MLLSQAIYKKIEDVAMSDSRSLFTNANNLRAIDFYIKRLQQFQQATNFIELLQQNFPAETLNVISIGCGPNPIEIPALEAILKRKFNYTGIDTSRSDIDKNNQQFKENDLIKFYNVDASNLNAVKMLFVEKAHLIILRHPILNIKRPDFISPFLDIYLKVIPYILEEKGSIIVSNYHPNESVISYNLLSSMSLTAPIKLDDDGSGATGENGSLQAEHYFHGVAQFHPASLFEYEHSPLPESVLINELRNNIIMRLKNVPSQKYPDVFLHLATLCLEASSIPNLTINTLCNHITNKFALPPEQINQPETAVNASLNDLKERLENFKKYCLNAEFNLLTNQITDGLLSLSLGLKEKCSVIDVHQALRILSARPVGIEYKRLDDRDDIILANKNLPDEIRKEVEKRKDDRNAVFNNHAFKR